METTTVQVTLPKEAAELAEGIGKFVLAVREATKDGFQVGQDLPVLITSAMADLIPAIQGAEKIGAEFQLSKAGVVMAFALTGAKVADMWPATPAAPQA